MNEIMSIFRINHNVLTFLIYYLNMSYKEIATLEFDENVSDAEFSNIIKPLKQNAGIVLNKIKEDNKIKYEIYSKK